MRLFSTFGTKARDPTVTENQQPILILGAGINGAAIARELVLNGLPVCVVDTGDLAGGTTAYSSRLIHGGLRYLEYGEFALVRESLHERRRLLRLAPQFVRPLRFHIPIRDRAGGWFQALSRFFGRGARFPLVPRGLWLVKLGLTLYDWISRDERLAPAATVRLGPATHPLVDRSRFRWACSYSDAQILYPERFVVALLQDARQIAEQQNVGCDIFTYHHAVRCGRGVAIRKAKETIREWTPAAVINATGAWVDETLEQLEVSSPRLIGGTKGSHLLVDNPELARGLKGAAIYVEAEDGRPVFLLPFSELTLIGTTDCPFADRPHEARVDDAEIDYLLGVVHEIFPTAGINKNQIALHYTGVRPLPYTTGATAAGAITRRHSLKEHRTAGYPTFSVVGGKLTTCRALAEQTAQTVLKRLGRPQQQTSRLRPLPGGEGYPKTEEELQRRCATVAREVGLTPTQVEAVWRLCGSQAELVLAGESGAESIDGTEIPVRFVRHVIKSEWVRHLGDLIERRLMLLYRPRLSKATLNHVARILEDEQQVSSDVSAFGRYLQDRYGREIAND